VQITETSLPGVVIVEPRVFSDERGYFFESWNAREYADAGIVQQFVQDNVSYSTHGVLRGLHFQHPTGQAKLVSVLRGEVYDVAVDVRRGSATQGRWVGVTLSAENRRQLMIPAGFAHGFLVTGSEALFSYKTGDYYDPASERIIAWNDPDLAIAWPLSSPRVSPKDASGLSLRDIAPDRLPVAPGMGP
jgi:dTDP-4-dehydrorhamnose 3,5-epimerase